MNETTEVRCPKCGSNQLTANKKGFSGKKAVAGAVLTGGIGLLAGTIGSGKVIITCLACGHRFKAGEGKVVSTSPTQAQPIQGIIDTPPDATVSTNPSDPIDQRILEITQQQGKLSAVKFCKDAKGWDLKTSKDYVDNLTEQNGVKGKEGCFIATACYGDYNAEEVLVLRAYRDNILKQNYFGRLFIKVYYFISPTLSILIAKSDKTKTFVRKHLLKHLVTIVGQEKNGL